MCCFSVRLYLKDTQLPLDINVSIFARLHDGSIGYEVANSGYYAHAPQGVATDPVKLCPYGPGK
jgi:hypothetical protein